MCFFPLRLRCFEFKTLNRIVSSNEKFDQLNNFRVYRIEMMQNVDEILKIKIFYCA